ncbi:MAG: hypothetical protein KDB94_08215 [Acidobacteria bacterium]|nr:hypothetical protein [Acidobacteriota bacterium]
MAEGFDYRAMVHAASIGVVRSVLEVAAREGFPADHHAFLTFATSFPGVEIPAAQAALHPETMTIVLQNQYWGLEVGEEAFSVELRFDGRLSRVTVPFEALTTFIDPSVPFGLDLATFGGGGATEPDAAAEEAAPEAREPASEAASESASEEASSDGETRSGGGEVLPFRPR